MYSPHASITLRLRLNRSDRKYGPSPPWTVCASAAAAISHGLPVSAHRWRKEHLKPWETAFMRNSRNRLPTVESDPTICSLLARVTGFQLLVCDDAKPSL